MDAIDYTALFAQILAADSAPVLLGLAQRLRGAPGEAVDAERVELALLAVWRAIDLIAERGVRAR